MSEIEAPAPESVAAPTSTADIAAEVLNTYEVESAESTPTETAGTTTEAPAPEIAATEPEKPTEAELSAAAKFLQTQGHRSKTVDGRETWFKYNTVERMLDRYVGERSAGWDSERTTLAKERDALRSDLDELYTDVRGEPKAFLEKLASLDARYAPFVSQPAPQTREIPNEDPEPEPDVDLGDGRRTYSLDGLRKLRAWDRRQYERVVDERLKPLNDREKQDKERAETEQFNTARRERLQSQMREAQTWPDFGQMPADGTLTDFQKAILKRLQDDTAKAQSEGRAARMTLREAYLEERLNRQRSGLLQELKTTPPAPTVGRTGAEATRAPRAPSTADIARQVLAESSRQ